MVIAIATVTGQPFPKLQVTADGSLASTAEAELLESDPWSRQVLTVPEELGVGKRKRRPNILYSSDAFWRHKDEDGSDIEDLDSE